MPYLTQFDDDVYVNNIIIVVIGWRKEVTLQINLKPIMCSVKMKNNSNILKIALDVLFF